MEALTIYKYCDNCADKDVTDPICKGKGRASGCWLADASVHSEISSFFFTHPNAVGFTIIPVYANTPVKEEAAVENTPMKAEREGGGTKYDNGKPRFDLIPPEALFGLAELYRMGAAKYADRNWEKGMGFTRLFGAMQRHAWAWMSGEDYAPDDHQHHLLSVAWCAIALYTYWCRGLNTEFDDRPHNTLTEFPPVLPEHAVTASMMQR
jgi:hypothetical protein